MTVEFDPRRPEIRADPYPALRRLQAEEPAHWSDVLGGWVLTRYADVRAALHDPRLSADRITPFVRHQAERAAGPDDRRSIEALGRLVGRWAVFTDPPLHTRLRALLNTAFTARAVERLRPRIAAIVDELLAAVAGRDEVDVIRDFAYPLPLTVIGELLGVPGEARARFKAWSDELATFVGSALGTPDRYQRAARSLGEMADCFRGLIAARRAGPRDDLLTGLIHAEDRGAVLSEDELVATAILLLFAGHETTTNLIGNGVLALLRQPAALAAWRADPGLTPGAVEEIARFDGPTGAMTRVARDDIPLHGRTIRSGDRVFLMINAANRDPRQFADPDRLDLARGDSRHLAFGYGPHFCLGAPLARLEAQLAFPPLLAALREPALATDRLEWLDSVVFRGVRALPLRLSAG